MTHYAQCIKHVCIQNWINFFKRIGSLKVIVKAVHQNQRRKHAGDLDQALVNCLTALFRNLMKRSKLFPNNRSSVKQWRAGVEPSLIAGHVGFYTLQRRDQSRSLYGKAQLNQ